MIKIGDWFSINCLNENNKVLYVNNVIAKYTLDFIRESINMSKFWIIDESSLWQ